MKKLLALSLFTFHFSFFTLCIAQYTVLHSFNDTAGANPGGALTLSGATLYGMTGGGGANADGCIFSMDTTGNNYKDIFDFNGTNGAFPQGGSLKLSGKKMFGMVNSGGKIDSGCVFSINTDGSGYKDLLDFKGPNGSSPFGSLVLSGGKLFGMTYTGGKDDLGNIFTIDTAGHNYKTILDFNGANGADPFGDVTIIGKKLYGITAAGGANYYGNVFSVDSNGKNFVDLFDFSKSDGAEPNNLLTLAGSQFFGMTNQGGAPGNGNVFSLDTNGSSFKDMLDFNGQSTPFGANPVGDVIYSANRLYGMTSSGGANDSGVIFSADTTGKGYKDLFDFNSEFGYSPFSNVTISGNNLYGTTLFGGAYTNGVIFKFHNANAGINRVETQNFASLQVYPNPGNGIFTIRWAVSSGQWAVEVYNVLGEKVYSPFTIHHSPFTIDLSAQPDGVYFYRVIGEDGGMIGEGKVVVTH